MGYTHYWYRRPETEPRDGYGRLLVDTKQILQHCSTLGIEFADWGWQQRARAVRGLHRLQRPGARRPRPRVLRGGSEVRAR